jgi:hypothetical protein
VDGIVTEDSDLLLFGGQLIIYKLGPEYTGKELKSENLFKVNKNNKTTNLDFSGWSHDKFIQCCILAGCDYVKNVKGVAVRTAHDLFEKFHTIQNILTYLTTRAKNQLEEGYIEKFEKAYLTFKYQKVWCPIKKTILSLNNIEFSKHDLLEKLKGKTISKNLSEISSDLTGSFDKELLIKHYQKSQLDFLGEAIPQQLAQQIADCQIDPITKGEFEDIEFNFQPHLITMSEIQALGFKKIEGAHIQAKRIGIDESCMSNLTYDVDQDISDDEETKQAKIMELNKSDPHYKMLSLLLGSNKKQSSMSKVKASPFQESTRDTEIFNKKKLSNMSTPNKKDSTDKSLPKSKGVAEKFKSQSEKKEAPSKASLFLEDPIQTGDRKSVSRDKGNQFQTFMNVNKHVPTEKQHYVRGWDYRQRNQKDFKAQTGSKLRGALDKFRHDLRKEELKEALKEKRKEPINKILFRNIHDINDENIYE